MNESGFVVMSGISIIICIIVIVFVNKHCSGDFLDELSLKE